MVKLSLETRHDSHKILFAYWFAQTGDKITAYKKAFPKAEGVKYIASRAAWLIKQEDTMAIVKEAIESAAKAAGTDPSFVLKNFKRLAEKAKNEKVQVDATIELGKIIDIYPDEHVVTKQFGGIFQDRGIPADRLLPGGEVPQIEDGKPDDKD